MIGDPVVTIFCDRCADEIVTGLTPLAGGVWDGRNISGVTKRQHWSIDGRETFCEECTKQNAIDNGQFGAGA